MRRSTNERSLENQGSELHAGTSIITGRVAAMQSIRAGRSRAIPKLVSRSALGVSNREGGGS